MGATVRALPEVHSDLPLRGWRWVRLVRHDSGVRAASIFDHSRGDDPRRTGPVTFDADADATCRRTSHDAPTPGCTCGFWSVHQRIALTEAVGPRRSGWALAEVELSGTVVEAERGYRAGHQRILSVTVADRCEQPGCPDRSIGLATDDEGFLSPACTAHGAELPLVDATGLLGTEVRLGVLEPPSAGPDCRPSVPPRGWALTFLAALAGVAAVVAVSTHGIDGSGAPSDSVVLAAVVGMLTGTGSALRTRVAARGDRRAPVLDVLATLTALLCVMVAATAVVATTVATPR